MQTGCFTLPREVLPFWADSRIMFIQIFLGTHCIYHPHTDWWMGNVYKESVLKLERLLSFYSLQWKHMSVIVSRITGNITVCLRKKLQNTGHLGRGSPVDPPLWKKVKREAFTCHCLAWYHCLLLHFTYPVFSPENMICICYGNVRPTSLNIYTNFNRRIFHRLDLI